MKYLLLATLALVNAGILGQAIIKKSVTQQLEEAKQDLAKSKETTRYLIDRVKKMTDGKVIYRTKIIHRVDTVWRIDTCVLKYERIDSARVKITFTNPDSSQPTKSSNIIKWLLRSDKKKKIPSTNK